MRNTKKNFVYIYIKRSKKTEIYCYICILAIQKYLNITYKNIFQRYD